MMLAVARPNMADKAAEVADKRFWSVKAFRENERARCVSLRRCVWHGVGGARALRPSPVKVKKYFCAQFGFNVSVLC